MANNNTGKNIIDGTLVAMLVVVLVVVSALIVAQITSDSTFSNIASSGSVINETGAYINSSGYTLGQAGALDFSSPSVTIVFNSSDDVVIASGNYTVSATGVLTNASEENWEDVLVSYTYTYSTGRTLAGVNVTKISQDFGNFVTNLIAFLAVMGTILGVVWLVMYVRRLFDNKEGINSLTS